MLMVNNESLGVINQLRKTQLQLDTSFERLASGKRINKAADDAAGLQISERLTSDIKAGRQVSRNLSDGISYAQVAEGGLQKIATMLHRMRTLVIQAQSGINSESDRQALDKEVQELKKEIDATAHGTEIFNRQPLLGDIVDAAGGLVLGGEFINGQETQIIRTEGTETVAELPVGIDNVNIDFDSYSLDDDIQIFTRDGRHLVGTPIGDQTWTGSGVVDAATMESIIVTTANGFDAGATYDASLLNQGGPSTYGGMQFSFSGDRFNNTTLPFSADGRFGETLSIDTINEPLLFLVSGRGGFEATMSWTPFVEPSLIAQNNRTPGPVDITASIERQGVDGYIRMDKTPATIEDLGLIEVAADPVEQAEQALAQIDAALEYVGTQQGMYGAKINQMYSAKRSVDQTKESLSSARAQILDTDYASETARLTQQQIVEQASTSVLAQANIQPQQVLSLLDAIGG
jgi:flagellin